MHAPARGPAGPWIALSLGLALALLASLVAFALAWRRGARPAANDAELLSDPRVRAAVVAELVGGAQVVNDAHPDATVVRTLLPSVERTEGAIAVRTNAQGMRERDYVLPKPAGLVRVVLLGDSFVYGAGAPAEERLGAQLEGFLRARAGAGAPALEVLHLAVSSWSLGSECAYLRRQLDRLQPDLVVHVTHSNDLNDVAGVRGFGALATFTPAFPERADVLLGPAWERLRGLGGAGGATGVEARSLIASYGGAGLLPTGLGRESQTRFAAARRDVLGLAQALAALPGKPPYLLVGHWGEFAGELHAHIGRELGDAVLYTPLEFWRDTSTWIAANDNHWNARGHERMARVLYGTIRARGWLPALALAAWPEAEEEARAFAAQGRAFAEQPCAETAKARAQLAPVVDLRALERGTALQIHGGIDDQRLVSPYASLLLGARPGARRLKVTGRCLPDGVLRDAQVHVAIEGQDAGWIRLEPDAPIRFEVGLPEGVPAGEPLDVCFSSDDFVYRGDDLRHCVVFELERVALE